MPINLLYVENDNRDFSALREAIENFNRLEGNESIIVIRAFDPDEMMDLIAPEIDLILTEAYFDNPVRGERYEIYRLKDVIKLVKNWSMTYNKGKAIPIIAYTGRAALDQCLKERENLYDIWDKNTTSVNYVVWRLSNLIIDMGKKKQIVGEMLSDKNTKSNHVLSTQDSEKYEYKVQDNNCITPKVFISYASEDFRKVKRLYAILKEHGLRLWLDREDLLPGVDWEREIGLEIKQSDFVLFCLSARSINKRGYVQKELRMALNEFEKIPAGQTYLIPIRLEECQIPEELSKYHVSDVFRNGELDKLLKSILKTWSDSIQKKVNK